MIVETALKIAGPGSVLAARPTGVAHVVAPGPLTPGGGFIPRARRPVCRARTRRLRVLATPPLWSSLSPQASLPRLCARCSARLDRSRGTIPHRGPRTPSNRAEHPTRRLVTVADYRAAHEHTTPADLAFAVLCAATGDELAAVGHLSLVLLGHRGCTRPVPLPGGRIGRPLHQLLAERRRQVTPDEQTTTYYDLLDERSDAANKARIADLTAARQAREDASRAPRDIPIYRTTHQTGAPL